jgi:hypothetical protein
MRHLDGSAASDALFISTFLLPTADVAMADPVRVVAVRAGRGRE